MMPFSPVRSLPSPWEYAAPGKQPGQYDFVGGGRAAIDSLLWGRTGTSLGWALSPSDERPLPVIRICAEAGDTGALWIARGGSVPAAQAALRLEHNALVLVTRSLVHELNGKLMGIGCLLGDGANPQPISSSDHRLVEDAIGVLRDKGAYTSLILKHQQLQGATEFTPATLARFLQKTLPGAFQRHRPVDIQTDARAGTLTVWAAATVTIWSCLCARVIDSMPSRKRNCVIGIDWNDSHPGGRLRLRVQNQGWTDFLRSGTGGDSGPGLSQEFSDWLLLGALETSRLSWDGAELTMEFEHQPQPVRRLCVRAEAAAPSLLSRELAVTSGGFLPTLARMLNRIDAVAVSPDLLPQDFARIQAVCSMCGLPAYTAPEVP